MMIFKIRADAKGSFPCLYTILIENRRKEEMSKRTAKKDTITPKRATVFDDAFRTICLKMPKLLIPDCQVKDH